MKRRTNPRGTRTLDVAPRVVKENLVRADVNLQGRQTCEVSIEWRSERIVRVVPVQILPCRSNERAGSEQWIRGRAVLETWSSQRKIRPRRHDRGGTWSETGARESFGLRECEKRKSETAAGGVTNNPNRSRALRKHVAIDGTRVGHCRREVTLGSQTIVGNKDGNSRADGDLTGEMTIRACRPDDVRPAVKIKDNHARQRDPGPAPNSGHTADDGGLIGHTRRIRCLFHDLVKRCALDIPPAGRHC